MLAPQVEGHHYFGPACECNNFECNKDTQGRMCSGEFKAHLPYFFSSLSLISITQKNMYLRLCTYVRTYIFMCVYGICAGRGTCECGGVCECDTAPSGKPYTGEICECYPDVDVCQATEEDVSACVCVGVCGGEGWGGVHIYVHLSVRVHAVDSWSTCVQCACTYIHNACVEYALPFVPHSWACNICVCMYVS